MVNLHCVERLADMIVLTIPCCSDPRTVAQWSRHLGKSISCIRSTCVMAGESPKSTLDFSRVLRALVVANTSGLDFRQLFDVSDARTLTRLLARAGCTTWVAQPSHGFTIDVFMDRQRLIRTQWVLSHIRQRVGEQQPIALA